jgi:hypothetical protein
MPSPQSKPTRHWSRKTLYLAVTLLWVVFLPLVILNRQDIVDWWRLRSYNPPILISSISQQDAMSDYGQKIFYVNSPEVTGKNKFNQDCPTATAEQTIVLGCYHAGQNGIYIYDVADQRLDGVEQVTAAHEMLHAAYERMSYKERTEINNQLEDFYHNGLHDERILKTIDAYKQTEPNDVVNEMHSIFGTEVRDLPAPLQEHYKKYFSDRSKVVVFAEKYQAEFTSRQDAVTKYDNQLAGMKSQIDSLESNLKSQQDSINQKQKELIALRSSGDTTAYNAGVPPYNALIDSYNSQVQQLKALIAQYNQLVATRNSIALEENQLAQDLNSKAQTINN